MFQPHGSTFSTQVTVEIPYDALVIQSGDKACMIKAASTTATVWTEYCEGLTFANGKMTTTLSSFSVITIGVTDLTAPTISSLSASSIPRSGTRLRLSFAVDEVCSVYYVVLQGGSATPTSTQVVAGLAADGTSVRQTDPRVPPLVKASGVLNYDSSSAAKLIFTLKGLASGTSYDIHLVAKDLANHEGTVNSISLDTADDVAPVITLFEGHGFKRYKRGAHIDLTYATAYDVYDGDLSSSLHFTGGLSTESDVSSVKISVKDAAGNVAVAYGACNCLACYPKRSISVDASNRQNLMYTVDSKDTAHVKAGHTVIEQEDDRVLVVNSKLTGAYLERYQRDDKRNDCYCKCRTTTGLPAQAG